MSETTEDRRRLRINPRVVVIVSLLLVIIAGAVVVVDILAVRDRGAGAKVVRQK